MYQVCLLTNQTRILFFLTDYFSLTQGVEIDNDLSLSGSSSTVGKRQTSCPTAFTVEDGCVGRNLHIEVIS